MQQVSKEILQERVGTRPLGFKMSPYWQEQCTYLDQQNVFKLNF